MPTDRRAFLTSAAAGAVVLGCAGSSQTSAGSSAGRAPSRSGGEDKEKQMLGDRGFEHAVDEVARLEQAFGLDDLAKLTA